MPAAAHVLPAHGTGAGLVAGPGRNIFTAVPTVTFTKTVALTLATCESDSHFYH